MTINPNMLKSKIVKVPPTPMAHRVALLSVPLALGHMSANAVKATAGGWSTDGPVCLTSPLHSTVFGMTRPGLEFKTFQL